MDFLLRILGLCLLTWFTTLMVYLVAGVSVMLGTIPPDRGAQWFALATTLLLWATAGAVITFVGIAWYFAARIAKRP